MNIESLFGDYTIKDFRELLKEKYKEETGKDAIGEGTDGIHCVVVKGPTFDYMNWVMDLTHTLVGRLYEEKALRSGKALTDSGLLKEVVLSFDKNKKRN